MTRFQLDRGPVPLHHQIFLDLRAALAAGEWNPGERLPTELDLSTRYGCSLITVRRALDDLRREGRLERSRGRGTFVTRPPIVRDLAGQVGFSDELRSLGYEPYAIVVEARGDQAPPAVAAALNIAAGDRAFYLERVRGADGVPLLLEQVWLPAAPLPDLLSHDFSRESLWDVLEASYGLPIERSQEVITAAAVSAREARLLDLSRRGPAVVLDGMAFTTGDLPIECGRTVVSPERARYYVASTGARGRAVTPASGSGGAGPGGAGPGGSRPRARVDEGGAAR